jgi:serine/threonine protein phosphatase PrpC
VGEPLFVLEHDGEEVLEPPLALGRAALLSARSPDKQGPNEDGALALELAGGRLLLAVADGLGGRPGGASAARAALETLAWTVRDHDGLAPLREAVLEGFDRANRAVLERCSGGATTLVACAVEQDVARTYHVGDACALLVGGRGRVKHQTLSHSPTGYGVEAGLLCERAALHHEERHLVSNVIGASDMRVEMSSPLRLAPRDTLLLASDGLFDNLHVPEIVAALRRGPLPAAVARLARRCRARMRAADEPPPEDGSPPRLPAAPDDLTVLAWRP